MNKFLRARLSEGQPVASICGSVDYLAREGFLTGYKHTGNAQYLWKDYNNYQNPADFREKQAVRDKNLVTANGTAALDFSQLVLELIGFKRLEAQKAVDLYRLGFYRFSDKYGNPFI
ncbi:DJ-1/PfpI family protein [Enterococcus hirae]|nr:DJ-1/PfpI family protein [Enterococcus hirae]